jgi:DNA-binding CsgD family transcriptional regulator
LSDPRAQDRLRLAIDVADPALADRIASLLAEVAGLELVDKNDDPDAIVVTSLTAATEPEANVTLTARELEVLALLAEGASNKLIGRRLGISAHTAKYHVAQLLEKLDAVSRTDAVAHAARIGVLNL